MRVELLDGAGGRVAEGRAVVEVAGGTQAVTVVITRDCRDAQCPGAGDSAGAVACLGGRCVDPRCSPERPQYCPAPLCTTAVDCAPRAACATPRCISGTCLYEPNDGACSADMYCNPNRGCVDRGSRHVSTCPGCPCFPGTDCSAGGTVDAGPTPPACMSPSTRPTLVYPPDQVLLPPNTNAIEVQFLPGAGNRLFEIDFQNAATDVRLITRCNKITNTRGIDTGGCGFSLTEAQWQWIADVNRGGNPLRVTVRAAPADASCVAASDTRDILFTTEDVQGAVYYWQSVTVDGEPGRAGGIYRFDFGRRDVAPEPFLESSATTSHRCYGCHFLSRDGLRISFGSDDPDADDEYGDLRSFLMDIATRTIAPNRVQPGFRTFSNDHAFLLATDGRARNASPVFYRLDGNDASPIDLPSTGTMRGTQPDWAPDDSRVVYAQPATFYRGSTYAPEDDDHFSGASLYTMRWDGTSFGAPTVLLAASSPDENDYYPTYTPDGAFILFDRVTAAGLDGDAFSNPRARIWAMPAGGGTPVDLAALNQGDNLGNSWPRTSPYVQMDRGHRIVWVTFSSSRDYGLRVQNQDPAGAQCYPPESPENMSGSHICPLVPASCMCVAAGCSQFCVQPQIWMAAVDVDTTGGIGGGKDTSHPAFWLPFQEITAHNHVAQWAASIPEHALPDAGLPDAGPAPDASTDASTDAGPSCGGLGAGCGAGTPLCCAAYYCGAGNTCQVLL